MLTEPIWGLSIFPIHCSRAPDQTVGTDRLAGAGGEIHAAGRGGVSTECPSHG